MLGSVVNHVAYVVVCNGTQEYRVLSAFMLPVKT